MTYADTKEVEKLLKASLQVHATAQKWQTYLSQDEFWVNIRRERILVKDMPARYCQNALNLLIRRAPQIFYSVYAVVFLKEILKSQDLEINLDEDNAGSPEEWIVSSKLAKALQARIDEGDSLRLKVSDWRSRTIFQIKRKRPRNRNRREEVLLKILTSSAGIKLR